MDYKQLIRRQGRLRNLSPRTIKTYIHCVDLFMRRAKKEVKAIRRKDIENYLLQLRDQNKSRSTLNVHLSAIKFLFETILRKKVTVSIPLSRKEKKLPLVLSQKEVRSLLHCIQNPKQQFMIQLLYGAGLRVSELCNLRKKDLDLENSVGWVRQGKGRKDRRFIIPRSLVQKLMDYTRSCKEEDYVFKGYRGAYSSRSVYEIVKRARKKAGIKKKIHPHTLRHSFATHLVENGYDVERIQSLLGHSSVETTMIYVHVAQMKRLHVESPLDHLDEEKEKVYIRSKASTLKRGLPSHDSNNKATV